MHSAEADQKQRNAFVVAHDVESRVSGNFSTITLRQGEHYVVLEFSAQHKRWRYVLYRGKPNAGHTNIIAGSDYVYETTNRGLDAANACIERLAEDPIIGIYADENFVRTSTAKYQHEDWFKPSRMVEELAEKQTQGLPQDTVSPQHTDHPRASWHQFFMELADFYAMMSTCTSKVGAVLADEATHEILGTGFNGAPHGMDHCTDVGCQQFPHHSNDAKWMCVRCIHAEVNALTQMLKNNSAGRYRYSDAVLYVTRQPCHECLKLLVQWDIHTVYYREPYQDKRITKELQHRVAQRQVN